MLSPKIVAVDKRIRQYASTTHNRTARHLAGHLFNQFARGPVDLVIEIYHAIHRLHRKAF